MLALQSIELLFCSKEMAYKFNLLENLRVKIVLLISITLDFDLMQFNNIKNNAGLYNSHI